MRFTNKSILEASGCANNKMVIYALIFTWEENGKEFWDWYWGRSQSSVIRLQAHRGKILGSSQIKSSFMLYERAREIVSQKEGDWAWIPVVILPKDDRHLQKAALAMKCLEETMITLSGSYCDIFLRWSLETQSSYWDVGLARRLTEIAKQVYAAQPGASLPSVRGCNVASPIMEPAANLSSSLWVRTTVYKEDGTPDMYVYTGKARLLPLTPNRRRKMGFIGSRTKAGGGQDKFEISWLASEMEGVTTFIPSFELKINPDEAHPDPILDTPDFGHCERSNEVKRLALKTEYVHGDGSLRENYNHCKAPTYPYVNDKELACVNSDGKAKYFFRPQREYLVGHWVYSMSWILTLLNTKLQTEDGSNTWPVRPYSAMIKCVEPAFLFQATVVTDMAKGAPRPAPQTRVNLDDSYYYLINKFGEAIPEMDIGILSPGALQGNRFNCDTCFIVSSRGPAPLAHR